MWSKAREVIETAAESDKVRVGAENIDGREKTARAMRGRRRPACVMVGMDRDGAWGVEERSV